MCVCVCVCVCVCLCVFVYGKLFKEASLIWSWFRHKVFCVPVQCVFWGHVLWVMGHMEFLFSWLLKGEHFVVTIGHMGGLAFSLLVVSSYILTFLKALVNQPLITYTSTHIHTHTHTYTQTHTHPTWPSPSLASEPILPVCRERELGEQSHGCLLEIERGVLVRWP